MTQIDVDTCVLPNRVHRSVYVDPEIFELELKKIFSRTWIYVGHESQVANTSDYYATRIGRQPVVMVRDKDSKIRVFLNRCLHKGTQLVPEGAGHAPGALRCGYHGWVYALDGALRTIPARSGYDEKTVRPGCEEF